MARLFHLRSIHLRSNVIVRVGKLRKITWNKFCYWKEHRKESCWNIFSLLLAFLRSYFFINYEVELEQSAVRGKDKKNFRPKVNWILRKHRNRCHQLFQRDVTVEIQETTTDVKVFQQFACLLTENNFYFPGSSLFFACAWSPHLGNVKIVQSQVFLQEFMSPGSAQCHSNDGRMKKILASSPL